MRLKHLVMPPSAGRYELLKPSRRTGADYFIDLLELYDGSNAEHVLDTMAESGFLHSAIPAPKNFILGVCSEEEIAEAKSGECGNGRLGLAQRSVAAVPFALDWC